MHTRIPLPTLGATIRSLPYSGPSLIAGGDPDRNLAWAAAMGAWAVSTRGDWEGLPTLDELSDSLRHNQTSDSVMR